MNVAVHDAKRDEEPGYDESDEVHGAECEQGKHQDEEDHGDLELVAHVVGDLADVVRPGVVVEGSGQRVDGAGGARSILDGAETNEEHEDEEHLNEEWPENEGLIHGACVLC